jgi:DNA-binding CsgD family transcriptional regulator
LSVHFSQAQIARLSTLISVLLSPLDADSIDEWRRDAGRALGALVGGDQLYFLSAPLPGVDVMWTEGMSDALRVAYSARFIEDEGTNRALRAGATAINQTSIVAGDWAGYHADPLVNELFLPNGIHDVIGLLSQIEADDTGNTMWCRFHLGAARSPYGSEAFGESGLAMMRLAAPAFEAGVATLIAAGTWRSSLAGALDSLITAAWVFAGRGEKVIHRNATAAYLLNEDPEASIVESAVAALARSLAESADRTKSTNGNEWSVDAKTTVRTKSASYVLRGSYVAAARLGPSRTILVVARRTSRRPLDQAALRERHALTQRELQVAELVVDGFGVAEISQRLGISLHTARRHLEQLYKKLGVHSRGEAQRVLQA